MPRSGASLLSSILTTMGADEATCREAAFDEFAHLLSQLLHGEQAAMQLCGQLTNVCPMTDAKFYAGSQVNLKRLGLITERTEDAYRRIGVLYGDRSSSEYELPIGN